MRILAFDIGEKRIGIAVSDPLGYTAQGLETYQRCGEEEKDISYLLGVAERYRPVRLLFGMPRNMDGSYGFQAERVRAFADAVQQRFEGDIHFFDERLTSVSAERVLLEADLSRQKRRKQIDKVAAVLILQAYLDSGAGKV